MKYQVSGIRYQVAILLAVFAVFSLMPAVVFGQTGGDACSGPNPPFPCLNAGQNQSGSGVRTDTISGGPTRTDTVRGGSGIQSIRLPNPLQANTFQELIGRVVNFLLAIGAPILVLMIIIGAFQIMTGAGNPENITKGRQTITYAIIGYALLLLSKGITIIIEQLLGVNK